MSRQKMLQLDTFAEKVSTLAPEDVAPKDVAPNDVGSSREMLSRASGDRSGLGFVGNIEHTGQETRGIQACETA